MRWIAAVLFALTGAATSTPAAADLETCIAALEAQEDFNEARKAASATYSEDSRAAEAAYSAAISEAGDTAEQIRQQARADSDKAHAIAQEIIRAENSERGYKLRSEAMDIWASGNSRANDVFREARAKADAARREALAAPEAAREQAMADALAALRRVLTKAYPGPRSDNPKIMDRLLGKFLQECQRMLR